jgi:putative ATP-dependent endonuclease of the OLD family
LSFRHSSHKIAFDVGTSDASRMVDDVRLISKYNDKSVEIGGDGKNNQIFLPYGQREMRSRKIT